MAVSKEQEKDSLGINVEGVQIPPADEFRSLGDGIFLSCLLSTGPLLRQRIRRAGELRSGVRGAWGAGRPGAQGRGHSYTLVLATGLFGAEVASVAPGDHARLETRVVVSGRGPPSRGGIEQRKWCVRSSWRGTGCLRE